MDLNVTSDTGGAVACPVCTLYLREGISLQRHLNTHPKEQVIDALIKAASGTNTSSLSLLSLPSSSSSSSSSSIPPQSSSSPISTLSTSTSPSTITNTTTASSTTLSQSSQIITSHQISPQILPTTPQSHHHHHHHNNQSPQINGQANHIPSQSPYPIGPVFEYPPINPMMSPQFASFSYQQFVNNGTMMIPQYAMAPPPQPNQMMQMLYNPYSMYQQQQVPAVQMLSPVTTLQPQLPPPPTTTTTTSTTTAAAATTVVAAASSAATRIKSINLTNDTTINRNDPSPSLLLSSSSITTTTTTTTATSSSTTSTINNNSNNNNNNNSVEQILPEIRDDDEDDDDNNCQGNNNNNGADNNNSSRILNVTSDESSTIIVDNTLLTVSQIEQQIISEEIETNIIVDEIRQNNNDDDDDHEKLEIRDRCQQLQNNDNQQIIDNNISSQQSKPESILPHIEEEDDDDDDNNQHNDVIDDNNDDDDDDGGVHEDNTDHRLNELQQCEENVFTNDDCQTINNKNSTIHETMEEDVEHIDNEEILEEIDDNEEEEEYDYEQLEQERLIPDYFKLKKNNNINLLKKRKLTRQNINNIENIINNTSIIKTTDNKIIELDNLNDDHNDKSTNSKQNYTIMKIKKIHDEVNDELCEIDDDVFNYTYINKGSGSLPSSPSQLDNNKLKKSYCTKSEYGSSDNLYPVEFESNTMIDDEDEEMDDEDDDEEAEDIDDEDDDDDDDKGIVDNFDEEDMEIGEISTTQSYSNRLDIDNNKISSHTPVTTITTTISGLKNLRGRKNLLKDNYHQSSSSSSSATAAVITPPSTTSSSTTTPPRSFERVTFKTYHDDDDDDEDDEDEDEDDEEIRMKQKNIHKNYSTGRKVPTITSTITNNIINNKQNDNVYHQSVITEHVSSFPQLNTINSNQEQSSSIIDNYIMSSSTNNKTTSSTTTITTTTTPSSSLSMNKNHDPLDLSDITNPTTSNETKSFQSMNNKIINNIPNSDLLNINEDAHSCPLSNVFEFDGLQILVPSTFISESSQKAISATSQQSMASSEGGGVGIDEEIKSVNMRADETMPPRGELSEQESNGCTEHSAWQLYVGQESSRMSTSYDLMARESWEESEGSDNETGVPLLDSRSLAGHFTSSLFLDGDRKIPTKQRTFKCSQCNEIFDCPKERRVHSTTVHKEAGPSNSSSNSGTLEINDSKDIKLLDRRMNAFEDIFVPGGIDTNQNTNQGQPLLHQMQPPPQQQEQQCYQQQQQQQIHQLQYQQQQQQQQQQLLLQQQQQNYPLQSSQLLILDNTKHEDNDEKPDVIIPQNAEISCVMCSQKFTSERSLQIHNKRVHNTEVAKRLHDISKCQICNEEFPSVVTFNLHLKEHPLECAQCGKYFYRKQNFKLHMKRHLGIKPFPCTVCDKAFLTKQKLDEHMNGHTGNAPVKCNLCNETFRRYSNLTQHKNRHHLNIKKKLKDFICHCGEVFHTKKKLAWHKETHDEKPKSCTFCSEKFIHMASLTRHMRRAHNKRFVPDAERENENVECPICKCIYLRSSLAVHMRVHNGERPYECQVCSKSFSTKWNLQLHKWTHAARSTKPFKCNQCSAAFYRHSDFTAHMNSHKNVRPYTCNYCGAQFIRKYNCLRHVKEHEENKQYTCDVCSKTFHRSYYLKEHLRVHSGARPYTCHICGKSSSTKSNHNKHVRIHHAREPVNTEN